jgi:hypothetical protein
MSKWQIEEMAKFCTYYHNGECCADTTNICECDLMCEMFGVFSNLENAGYRKQSEVAREIFEEIEKVACVYKLDGDFYINNGLYAEIKKKYTEN